MRAVPPLHFSPGGTIPLVSCLPQEGPGCNANSKATVACRKMSIIANDLKGDLKHQVHRRPLIQQWFSPTVQMRTGQRFDFECCFITLNDRNQSVWQTWSLCQIKSELSMFPAEIGYNKCALFVEYVLLFYYFGFEVMLNSFGKFFCVLRVPSSHLQRKRHWRSQSRLQRIAEVNVQPSNHCKNK